MFQNKKLTFFLLLVLVIVLIAVGVWIGLSLVGSRGNNANTPSPYTAVYMVSGDIYFGKLSWFPRLHLADAWYLERTTDASGKTQVGVAPLTSAFWGPVGDIYINSQSVLFYAPVKNGSQLVQAIENPSTVQQQTGQQQVPIASSTVSGK
jgi:hypothetical protein